jgi:glycosyltransferase involved in cell wall biosynthesis
MSREGLELARVARARNIPVVLSPICWYEPRSLRALSSSGLGVACDLTKWAARAFFPRGLGWRAALLEAADAIVPNSRAEAAQLVRIFRAEARKIFVVPNGVEARFAAANDTQFRERFGPEQFVLYVGRVEPRKNVLGLIRGARECGLPVVAVGDAVPGQASYARACHQEGRGVVRWLPRLEHDDPLLASAYAAARVFALPSWFETPGLAALEAALAGCAVVLTPFGCTYEYFGESVRYARPDRPAEIGRALAAAWDEGPAPGLSVRVARSFLWSEVSRATAEVYDRVAP